MKRAEILEAARVCVCGEREQDYGTPEDSFALIEDFYSMFQSITVDNGCEFQDYDGMEKACRRKGKRTTVYYCHPHAPHERGSNENMNRIIRRFFPKGTNFDEVPISEIRRAEEWMNNYPREVLGWKTAATLLRSYMSAC